MSYTDAIQVGIIYMESLYSTKTHTPAHLTLEWLRLAAVYGIDTTVESEAARLRQARATQSKFEAMTGMRGGGDDADMGDLG